MNRIKFCLAMAAALLAACGSKAPEPSMVEVVDTVVINDHNTLTNDFAGALNQARLLKEDAAVEDLAGTETYEHDVNALVTRLEGAASLAAKVENAPLPGDKEKAKMSASRMKEDLQAALAGAKALDQKVRAEKAAPADLAAEAGQVENHIRQAAEEHAALMSEIMAEENIDIVVWDEILPHHELAFNQSAALSHASKMLAHDSANADWKDYWKREAAALERRLKSAEAALPAVMAKVGPAAQSAVDEMKKLHASAQEHITALTQELSKRKPSFDKAKEHAEAAREQLTKAQAEHGKLMQQAKIAPKPQYDSKD